MTDDPTPPGEDRERGPDDASEADDASGADDGRGTDDRRGPAGDTPPNRGRGPADGTGGDGPETASAASATTADPEAVDVEDGESTAGAADAGEGEGDDGGEPPEDVRKYARFQKMDGAAYERTNEFLRDRTYVTAREWAIARLCADFRTETGVEMTKIGDHLPELVPFMTDTYTPQAVNQARASFEEKVRKAGATFLYGAMSDFFTAEELDDLMYEATEVAKFLLEVEGVDLSVDEELDAEERISSAMREVRESSEELRHDGVECPNCGHEIDQEG